MTHQIERSRVTLAASAKARLQVGAALEGISLSEPMWRIVDRQVLGQKEI